MTIDDAPRLATDVSFDFDRAQTFTMIGTPLLSDGRSADLLAVAPQMWVHSKVYAAGGERGLHSHPTEDHIFLLLAGRAVFRDRAGETTEVGPYEGIMIPRGVLYAFEAVGDENLVIVRVGAGDTSSRVNGRIAIKRSMAAEGTTQVRPAKGVPIPNQVFTAPPP